MSNKFAILSMDIEDWYHLYYFISKADKNYSMIDGFTNYVDLLNKYNVKTTFFVLGELAEPLKKEIRYAISCGHEIACHGYTHTRPIDLTIADFKAELIKAKHVLEDVSGKEIVGYRAPCYGIDTERYKILSEVGFKYSSSKMNVSGHPLYGEIDLSEFDKCIDGVYKKDDMMEFALSTEKFLGKTIAVSGGGWIRLLPWNTLMKPLIKKNLKNAECYTLYIHPFELSKKQMPKVNGTGLLTNVRARTGLGKVEGRIEKLIQMLKENNFEITTFANARQELMKK
ncbi:MAG: polysaccharide deacetylase family protein [Clostridia bacterium]|nr:polysaccharide deacetylase family protein [Clostridia bacterium]